MLETIFNDPELLQKIIQRNAKVGGQKYTKFLIQKLDILRKAKKKE